MIIDKLSSNVVGRIVAHVYVWILVFFLAAALYSSCLELASGEFYKKVHSLYQGHPYHCDFVRFYAMGQMAMSADRFHIYDPGAQLSWMNRVIAPAVMQNVFFMEHPPYVFFLGMLLTLFSIMQAYVVWNISFFLAATLGLWLLLRGGVKREVAYVVGLLFGLNASKTAWWCYLIGQLGMLLLGIVSIFWWAIWKKRYIVAGIALALSTIKPQHLPFLLVPVLAGKRWKVLTAAAVTELVLIVLSVLWFGWRNVVFYPLTLYRSELYPWTGFDQLPAAVCLRGALAVYLPKGIAAAIGSVFCVAILVVLFMLWRRNINQKSNPSWPIALTMVASCAVGPHTFLYDCSILAIAAGLTLPTLYPAAIVRLKPLSFRIWCILLVFYPLLTWILYSSTASPQYLFAGYLSSVSMVVLNLAILAAGMVYHVKPRH